MVVRGTVVAKFGGGGTGLVWARLIWLLVVAHAMSGQALARDYSARGPYLGVGVIGAFHLFEGNIEDSIESIGGTADVDHSVGLDARGGYRFLSWLALEAQYEWVPGFEATASFPRLGDAGTSQILDIESHSVTANARFILPLGRLEPYLLLGVGWSRYDFAEGISGFNLSGTEDAFAGRVGPGVDFFLTEHISLNLAGTVLLTTHDIDNVTANESLSALHYLSVKGGLSYHF